MELEGGNDLKKNLNYMSIFIVILSNYIDCQIQVYLKNLKSNLKIFTSYDFMKYGYSKNWSCVVYHGLIANLI